MLALSLLGNNGVPPIGAAAAASAAALAVAAREAQYSGPIAIMLENMLDFSDVLAAVAAAEPLSTDRIDSGDPPSAKRSRLLEGYECGSTFTALSVPSFQPNIAVVAASGGSISCLDIVGGLASGCLPPDSRTSAAIEGRLPPEPVMFAARANWRFVAIPADAVCGPLFDAEATPPAALGAGGAAAFRAAQRAIASWRSGASSTDGSKPWGKEGCAYTVPTEPGGPLAQLFVVTSPAASAPTAAAGAAMPGPDAGLVSAYAALLREVKAYLFWVGGSISTSRGSSSGRSAGGAASSATGTSSSAAAASAIDSRSIAAHGKHDSVAKPAVNAFDLLGKKPAHTPASSPAAAASASSLAAGDAGVTAGRAAAGGRGDGGPTGLGALRQIAAAPEKYPDSVLFADRYPGPGSAASSSAGSSAAAAEADNGGDAGAWIALRDKYPKSLVHALVLVRPPPAGGSSKSSAAGTVAAAGPVSDSLLGVPSVLKLQPRHLPALRAMREAARRAWVAATSELAAALSSRVTGWEAGAAAAGLLPSEFDSHARVGFHALPSLQPLHLHVMSRDGHSEAVKNKVHVLSFTHHHFFLPLDGVIAALEQQQVREAGGELAAASGSSTPAAGGAGISSASAAPATTAVDLGPAATARAEAALKGSLACHVCGRAQTNLPTLKVHLFSCLPAGDWLRRVPPAKAR